MPEIRTFHRFRIIDQSVSYNYGNRSSYQNVMRNRWHSSDLAVAQLLIYWSAFLPPRIHLHFTASLQTAVADRELQIIDQQGMRRGDPQHWNEMK